MDGRQDGVRSRCNSIQIDFHYRGVRLYLEISTKGDNGPLDDLEQIEYRFGMTGHSLRVHRHESPLLLGALEGMRCDTNPPFACGLRWRWVISLITGWSFQGVRVSAAADQ